MFFNYDQLSFQIMSVFRMTHPDGTFHITPRPFAALSFRVSGQGTFTCSSANFIAQKGNISFFPANMDYDATYRGSEIIVAHLANCSYHAAENVEINNIEYFSSLFSHLLERWDRNHSINYAKADLFRLLAKIEEDQAPNRADAFRQCSLYMQENYTNPALKIADICRIGQISEAGLYRHFRDYYGLSPKQYLVNLRLHASLEWLLQGTLSMQQIAEATGFTDAKYFSRAFKKHFGRPPSAYQGEICPRTSTAATTAVRDDAQI